MRGGPGALCLLLLAAAAAPAADAPLPYVLSVRVDWAEPLGPESVRDAFETELLLQLRQEACFEALLRADVATERKADLSLEVLLGGYRQQTDFEYGVHHGDSPDLERSRRALSRVEADVQAEVRLLPSGELVRERRFKQRATWRPLWQEDAREASRREFVNGAARTVRKFACKGSAADWNRRLKRVREQGP